MDALTRMTIVNSNNRPPANAHHATLWVPKPYCFAESHSVSGLQEEDVELVKAWVQTEPPQRCFVVEDLVPTGAVTSLFGDGGQGKSFLALYLATLVCQGEPFAGKAVQKGVALYLDGELEKNEFLRRAYKIARGLGSPHPPVGLHYYRLPGSLSDPHVQDEVRRRVEECKPHFIVLDSLTMAAFDTNPSSPTTAIKLIKFLETLGTVLAIDHTPKAAPGGDPSATTQFGSTFKRNAIRSQMKLMKAPNGAITLLHVKANFGSQSEPLHLVMEFTPNNVRFEPIVVSDSRLADIEEKLPTIERVYRELARNAAGVKPMDIAQLLRMKSPKTVKNALTKLRQEGRAEPCGDGRWRTVPKVGPISNANVRDRD